MHWKRLARALERNWIKTEESQRRADIRCKKMNASVAKVLRSAVKFELDVELPAADMREARLNVEAMGQAGLIRLPAKVCYFEAQIHRDGLHRYADADGHTIGVMATIGERGGIDLCSYMRDGKGAHWIANPIISNVHDDGEITYTKLWERHDEEMEASLAKVPSDVFCVGLTLLVSRGVYREAVGHVDLVSRDMPQDGYTIVRVPTEPRSEGGGGMPCRQRKRMRMHLRRGHVRRQRFGRDLARVKEVWIEPTFVGHVSEGVLQHEYRID